MVKVARNWKFATTAGAVGRSGKYNKTLPAARLQDLGKQLAASGYQVRVPVSVGCREAVYRRSALLIHPTGTAVPSLPPRRSSILPPSPAISSPSLPLSFQTCPLSSHVPLAQSSSSSLPFSLLIDSCLSLPNAYTIASHPQDGLPLLPLQVFSKGNALYAFKGIAGRYAPIGVHVSMLAVMFGVIFGAAGGYKGSVMVPTVRLVLPHDGPQSTPTPRRLSVSSILPPRPPPSLSATSSPRCPSAVLSAQGGEFLVADFIRPYTPLASQPGGASAVVKVNDFRITYRENGQVEQYFTDLQVTDVTSGAILKVMSCHDF